MIPNKHHHYNKLETFLEKKFSADPEDTSYTYGGTGEIYQGEPDISWKSIVFIKDEGLFCTHGKIYDASGFSKGLKNPVLINGTVFDGTSGIVTETWGKPRKIMITSGKNISEATITDGGGDIILSLPPLLDTNVTKDSLGRSISDTYSTKDDLIETVEGTDSFYVYSSDLPDHPSLTTSPADSWDTPELKRLHSGDYYVTSEGKVFHFKETSENHWEWVDITDFYLYRCLGELQEVKKKIDITGGWEKTQTMVETGKFYILGRLENNRPYLDVLSCPGSVNYSLTTDTNLYLPFCYSGSWTRTLTRYHNSPTLITFQDLSGISGKSIVITNLPESIGFINIILGSSPKSSSQNIVLVPGEVCIITLRSGIFSGNLGYYWELEGPGKLGTMSGWK